MKFNINIKASPKKSGRFYFVTRLTDNGHVLFLKVHMQKVHGRKVRIYTF
ncbi:MAG: hypothetical protein IPN55_05910 [Saprospiraceae bacterium]|nr:hypothetical protein [Candidatus Brachybacter algidus]